MFEMADQKDEQVTARSLLNDGVLSDGGDRPPLDQPLPLILPLYANPLASGQEQVRLLLISSPSWVRETIHDLHARGFANTNDWSNLLPGANPGEVVSILTQWQQWQ